MFYLLWQTDFQQTWPGSDNHNRLTLSLLPNMGRRFIWWLYRCVCVIFVNSPHGCCSYWMLCWIGYHNRVKQIRRHNKQLWLRLLFIRKMCLLYFWQDVVKLWFINWPYGGMSRISFYFIACKSIQLWPEAFWLSLLKTPLGNQKWNERFHTDMHWPIGLAMSGSAQWALHNPYHTETPHNL